MSQKHPFSLTIFFLLAILIIAAFFAISLRHDSSLRSQKQSIEELKSQIKQELTLELHKDVETIVKQQVEKEVALYLAQSTPPQTQNLSQTQIPDETINQAVNRVIKEILAKLETSGNVSNAELDTYVASGGIDFNLPIAGGLTKIPQADYDLAAAETTSEPTTTNQTKKAKKKPADAARTQAKPAAQKEAPKNQDESHEMTPKRVDSIEKTLQQKGSILLPKGTLVVEPSTTWSHFSSNKIHVNGITILDVFTIGEINGQKITRDIFIETLGFKYGLMHNFQTEIKIPYRFQHDSNTTVTSTETTQSDSGIGDIDLGVSRQIGWEHGLVPDLILNLGVKTITGKEPYNRPIGQGSGHWALRSSLIAAKSSDPVVIFGSLGYTYAVENNFENYGDVKPGNSIAASVGTAIALSYQTAINFSFDASYVGKTTINGREVPGSHLTVANFKSGFTWALNERASVDFGVSIGLTNDSPDVTVDLRFPITF